MSMHENTNEFHPADLVTWHDYDGNRSIPVPGVVVRLELDSILIKAHVQGAFKELYVKPKELVSR
jgi:hypothetical protein